MNTSIYKLLSQSLGFTEKQIEKTIELLDSGATIPFISRYRKEATGSLDEVQIGNIKEAYDKLCETEKRKKFIISTIEEQGKLSEELKQRIDSCWDITELEDIYLRLLQIQHTGQRHHIVGKNHIQDKYHGYRLYRKQLYATSRL